MISENFFIMRRVPYTATRLCGENCCIWMKCFRWLYLLLLFIATSASALDVQQIKWGFDDKVVPGRFNVISVLVANSSSEPFDGTVDFYKSRGLERVGAINQMPCYLSPLTARWLQFYVFVDNQYDQWRLEWGRGADDHHDMEAPKWSSPAQVILFDADAPLSAASAFKQFPDELFPPTVAATSGLDSLLLDHAPRWEQAKRQAFLDWLRAGGKVHLLMGADGRYPIFKDELDVLNTSADRARIGSGLVVRHAATAREIKKQDVQDDVSSRELKPNEQIPNQTTDSFFRVLSRMSQRHYSWGGIYLLALAYLALVGPGIFVAGRKVADYRLRIALLLATIAGFTLLFNFVGRRGQGESSVVHSLSYARAIDGDTYDVTQWVNVFVARGADYTITHAAPHNLYATGQDYEAVNGLIENGKDGKFLVDLPMFSRRAFLHEAEMKGINIPVKVENWNGAEKLTRLTVTVGPDFTKQILDGWVVLGNRIYKMKSVNGRLEFAVADSQPLDDFVSDSNQQLFQSSYAYMSDDTVTNVENQFRKMATPLIAWSLGAENIGQTKLLPPQPGDRAQLFLFARSPESFSVHGSDFGHETGYVLYHFNLFKPES